MIKHDHSSNRDPLSYEATVREDGSFNAEAMHHGLAELVGRPPETMTQDFGGVINRLELSDCLTALANLEAMRTFLIATLGSCVGLKLPREVVAGDVNDMLEAAQYGAKIVARHFELVWVGRDWRVATS